MCKMSLKEIGDMQLSRQIATDWGHGMKQHGALMSRKSKARATILSCVDILQEKWSQRTFIAPPNKIKLNNKATHVIYYNVCLLHKQQCLLPGSLLPAEVFSLRLAVSQRGGSGKPWMSVWERIRSWGALTWTAPGTSLSNMDRHIKQTPVHCVSPSLCPQLLHSSHSLWDTGP